MIADCVDLRKLRLGDRLVITKVDDKPVEVEVRQLERGRAGYVRINGDEFWEYGGACSVPGRRIVLVKPVLNSGGWVVQASGFVKDFGNRTAFVTEIGDGRASVHFSPERAGHIDDIGWIPVTVDKTYNTAQLMKLLDDAYAGYVEATGRAEVVLLWVPVGPHMYQASRDDDLFQVYQYRGTWYAARFFPDGSSELGRSLDSSTCKDLCERWVKRDLVAPVRS